MDTSKLTKGELIATIGGLILGLAVFLPAYSPSDNPNARVAGGHVDASIFDAQHKMRILLLLAAIAPVILIYIILRDNELSWPKGEVTAVLGLVAITLCLYSGVIDRPGDPDGQISLAIGWYLAMIGALTIAAGGAVRASTVERRRKPPGVL